MNRTTKIAVAALAILALAAGAALAAKATPLIASFNAGELSPRLDARTDLEKYYSGARTLENMVVHPYGAATRRPGFKYVADAKNSDQECRLIPFEFSVTQAYVLEFGDSYMRVYRNGGQVGTADANTDLLLHMDGNDASTTITDDGDTGHSPSANGNMQLDDSISPKFGSASGFFGGEGDYVSVADHADWNFSGSEFTIDFWVRFDTYTAHGIDILYHQRDATTGDWVILFVDHKRDTLHFQVTDAGGAKQINESGTWAPNADTWYHIAVIRGWGGTTNDWAICVGGSPVFTFTDASAIPDHDQTFNIGGSGTNTWQAIDLSDDTRPVTFNGDATLAGTYNPYVDLALPDVYSRLGSLALDGNQDYLTVPDASDWELMSSTNSTWTMEAWVYMENVTTSQTVISHGDRQAGEGWRLYNQVGGDFYFYWGGVTYSISGGSPQDSTWQHLCVVRADGYIALYVDGDQVANTSYSSDLSYAGSLVIGADTWGASTTFPVDGYMADVRIAHSNVYGADTDNSSDTISYSTSSPPSEDADDKLYLRLDWPHFDGWIDEFRVSKGTARWTASFTPPTEPYPYEGSVGGGTVYELATSYTEEDVKQLQYAQSADTMWIVHPSHEPAKLTRTDHDNWTLSTYAPTADPFTGTDDYPAAVSFFEERLWFAATNDEPQTLWSTKSADFEDMTTGTNDDDAIEITIAADQVNVIRWLSPGKFLHIGTVGGEWRLSSGSTTEPVTPTNVQIKRDTEYGSAWEMPTRVGGSVIFMQRAKRILREIEYKFETDAYKAQDLTVLAAHVTESGVNYLDYQQNPNNVIWGVRDDGVLIGLTYLKAHDVYGWHRHPIGGTDAEVETIAVIPSSSNDDDELWACIKRNVNSSTVRYIEQMQPFFDGDAIEDAFFVDSGLSYDGSATTSVSGLDHLEGESVDVLADGVVVTGKTVSSGAISLSTAASNIHVGLGYSSVVEPMKLNAGSNLGTARGKKQRIHKIVAAFYETGNGVQYGPDTDDLKDFSGFTSGSLTTDDLEERFHASWSDEATISIVQEDPLPMTLMAIVPWVTLDED